MDTLPGILGILVACLAVFSATHALLNKRDTRASLGWIVVCFTFSGWGSIFYWLLGVNRVRTHAKKLHSRGDWSHGTLIERGHWPSHLFGSRAVKKKELEPLLRLAETVTRRPLTRGNRIHILHNGDEAYPDMLSAIDRSKKCVYLCTYIFDSDQTGRRFVGALSAALRRGVRVRVLVDGLGEWYSRPRISRLLREAGVPVAQFLPFSLSPNRIHPNLRNHRKILVVDGEVAFTGGMNIRDGHWKGDGRDSNWTEDMHFKVEGPVVHDFQEVFLEDWYFAAKESLPWARFPRKGLPGGSVCRGVSDGPNEDFEKLNTLVLGALSWAKRKVRIMTPYFIPDRTLVSALGTADLRGVDVEILLPRRNNLPFVDWASRACLWELLRKGVEIYYQPPPFVHSKMLVVDDVYSLVGSGNLDSRSLRLNFEFNLEIYDPAFAGKLGRHFEAKKRLSHRMTAEEVGAWSFPIKFRNALARLFSPYL